MPVNGSQFDPRLAPVYMDGRDVLGEVEWFDAHTHIGQNDPDGRKAMNQLWADAMRVVYP